MNDFSITATIKVCVDDVDIEQAANDMYSWKCIPYDALILRAAKNNEKFISLNRKLEALGYNLIPINNSASGDDQQFVTFETRKIAANENN